MRVAVVGTGFARQVHLPGYAMVDGADVVAICDNRPGRARMVAQEFDVPHWCENFDDLLHMPDVDLIDISTPPRLHGPMTKQALIAGKAVLCEKPMSTNWQDAKDMVDAAAQSGSVNALGHEFRYVAAYQFFRQLIKAGYLGELRLVVATALSGHALNPSIEPFYATWASMAAEGGGYLASSLSHNIDLTQFLFGELEACGTITQRTVERKPQLAWDFVHDDPLGPDALTTGMVEVTGNDVAAIQGRFVNGGAFVVVGSWSLLNGSGNRFEAHGSEGTLILDSSGRMHGAKKSEPMKALEMPSGLRRIFGDTSEMPRLFASLASDVACAVDGKAAPFGERMFCTFVDGLAVQHIISA